MYCCCICASFASSNFSSVLRHIGNTHSGSSNFSIPCPVSDCSRHENPYICYESFRSHVYRKHRELLEEGFPRLSHDLEHERSDADLEGADNPNYILNHGDEDGQDHDSSRRDFQLDVAKFLLKTREERRITQTALDGMVQDVGNLWESAMKKVGYIIIAIIIY